MRLVGPDVPKPLLAAFAAATDHAMVRPADVHYDQAAAVVTMPIRLAQAPDRSWLRALGVWRARSSAAGAARSRLVVRHVTACKIDVRVVVPPIDEVELIFGVNVDKHRLYACSAEEDRGHTCFSLDVTLSSLDIELATEGPSA